MLSLFVDVEFKMQAKASDIIFGRGNAFHQRVPTLLTDHRLPWGETIRFSHRPCTYPARCS